MTAVDTQGQITVPLDGRNYVLRPSFEAIASIERKLGRSLYELSGQALRGVLTIDDMAVVVSEMMRAYAKAHPETEEITTYRSVKVERVAEMIFEAGSPNITARIAVVLVGAVTGGYTASGEVVTGTK